MSKQPIESAQRGVAEASALHSVLDRSAVLRERAQALNLICIEPAWLGWQALHRFTCPQGHEFKLTLDRLLNGCGTCRTCREAAHMKRLQDLAIVANVLCLDTTWRGYEALYRFRCGKGHEWSRGARYKPGCPVCIRAAADAGKCLKDGLQRLIRAANERGGACLSDTYLGSSISYRFRCAEGHEWQAAASEVLRGSWCRPCAYERKRTQYMLVDGLVRLQQAAADKGGCCLSEVYEGSNQPYRFRCANGHEWQATGARILRGVWCLACANSQKRQQILRSDGLERLQQAALAKGGVCLSKTYLGHNRPHDFRCDHGHEWATTAASVFHGSWCLICAHEARRLGIEVARAAAKAHGGECLSQSYVGTGVKMSWMCDRGHVWQTTFAVIRRGAWCPDCAHMAQITNGNSKARQRYKAAGPALL